MKCLYCNEELVLKKDIFHADRGGIHLTIDSLPLYKCEQCGETLVPAGEVKAIQKTLRDLERELSIQAA